MARYASSSNTNKLANPFLGKTKAEMNKMYDEKIRKAGKSGEELRKIASQMQSALKNAPKNKPKQSTPKPAASKPPTSKPPTSKPAASTTSTTDAAAQRKTRFDGVGPSDAQRIQDSSPEAMKIKQRRGGLRSRPTGNARNKTTPKVGATKTVKRFNSRGKAVGTVTKMWDGKKWVTGKLGSQGAKG